MKRRIRPSILIHRQHKWHIFTLMILVSVVFPSCEKDHFFDFAKRTGKNVTITRSVNENFTKIILNDDVNLVITQGSTYSLMLEGGENLLPGIETTFGDSTLTIRNKNTLNWLRSYDKKITAYVTLPHLLDLHFEATSRVSNTDTIREDSLSVISIGGSGYIDLVIKTGISKLSISRGSADMTIKGSTGLNFIYSGAYGAFHCLELNAVYLYIQNKSPNDCFVNVSHHIEYNISGLGNIYYRGNPTEITGKVSSGGKLLKVD